MKTSINIPVNTNGNGKLNLLIEIGKKGISLVWFGNSQMKLEGLSVYTFEENENVTYAIAEVISNKEIIKLTVVKVFVAYNFFDSLIVPEKYYHPDLSDAMISLQFGEKMNYILGADKMTNIASYNIYRIPAEIDKMIIQNFPGAKTFHSASIHASGKVEGNHLRCIVFYDTLKVILYKGGVLHFFQQFNYKSPLDAVYHLLNTCQQHDLDPELMPVRLSGMIARDSVLFENLYNYFLDIDFEESAHVFALSESFSELPTHFFNHLIELAACES